MNGICENIFYPDIAPNCSVEYDGKFISYVVSVSSD